MPDDETQPVFKSAEAVEETSADFPGQALRYEREKAGLSVEDVARQLRLSVSVIRNLEAGNADALPEAVYTRGYVRSYCKLLKINHDPLLEGLAPEVSGQEEDFLPAMNERVHHLTRLWGSLIVLSGVVVLVSLWWTEQPREFRQAPQFPQDARPAQQPEFASPAPSAEPPQPPPETVSESAPEPAFGSAPESGEASFAPGDEPDEVPPRFGVPDEPVENETVEITVLSSESSWAQVVDGSGAVLIKRLLPPGYRNTVRGVFPLDFQFGDAREVRVWMDGAEYDLQRHVSRLNTAFFRVEGPIQ